MKTINLFFDFEFTSLSSDAQPISLGIVSDDTYITNPEFNKELGRFELFANDPFGSNEGNKSAYFEFSDFDINRCDDWVKENVVSKLTIKDLVSPQEMVANNEEGNVKYLGDKDVIRFYLNEWLSQFSGYQIQFVTDCGTFDWYWLLHLLAEWEYSFDTKYILDCNGLEQSEIKQIQKEFKNHNRVLSSKYQDRLKVLSSTPVKTGLPKLPANISPVPFDLNDLIAIKKGITPMESFELNREELCLKNDIFFMDKIIGEAATSGNITSKHNALWDAKVIKEIYNKLK